MDDVSIVERLSSIVPESSLSHLNGFTVEKMRVDFRPLPFGRTVGDNRSTLFVSPVGPIVSTCSELPVEPCLISKDNVACRFPTLKDPKKV